MSTKGCGWWYIILAPFLSILLGMTVEYFYLTNQVIEPLYQHIRELDEKTLVVEEDKRAEYYRGIYDTCIKAGLDEFQCKMGILDLEDAQWYEKTSEGWSWPIQFPKSGESSG